MGAAVPGVPTVPSSLAIGEGAGGAVPGSPRFAAAGGVWLQPTSATKITAEKMYLLIVMPFNWKSLRIVFRLKPRLK